MNNLKKMLWVLVVSMLLLGTSNVMGECNCPGNGGTAITGEDSRTGGSIDTPG